MKIGILTFQNGYRRGSCDFYPLIKWKKQFQEGGILFSFISSHTDNSLFEKDVVFIDHRYIRELVVIRNEFPDKEFIITIIKQLTERSIKVVFFDNNDGSGSEELDLIKYVDSFVKKQVLRDKSFYTKNLGKISKMPFLIDYDISEARKKKNEEMANVISPCSPDQVQKIKVGWNIGLIDYRYFPLSNYYPIGTSRLLNSVYITPNFNNKFSEKTIDSTFRGKISKKDENYSFQRNKVVDLFNNRKNPNLITGGVISKRAYLSELNKSKVCVSPFGWGEICYRDFEAIMAGCVLIKPDMGHLETYPNVYIKDKTYVPIKWDMSDLEEKINEVLANYSQYKGMVYNAQNIYKEAITDSAGFIKRFKKMIS